MSLDDDLDYAVKMYTAEQLKPHAEACAAGKCVSYVHCMLGRPRGGYAMPVCSRSIYEASLRDQVPVVQPPNDQRGRAVPKMPEPKGPTYLWVRWRCRHHQKANHQNVLWLLSAARTMRCDRCR